MFGPRQSMQAPAPASGHGTRRNLFTFLLCLIWVAHVTTISIVGAQEPGSAAIRTFDIPPQTLSSALLQFSDSTNLELLFDASMTRDTKTKGVSGDHSPEEALRILLEDTGLTYRWTSTGSVTLEKDFG